MLTTARLATASIAATVLVFLYWIGPRLSDAWLRAGGRIVQKAADRPRAVAAIFLTCLAVLWLVVALRTMWESGRDSRG